MPSPDHQPENMKMALDGHLRQAASEDNFAISSLRKLNILKSDPTRILSTDVPQVHALLNVELHNLWRYSFSPSIGTASTSGIFSLMERALYFGAGQIQGETVEDLVKNAPYKLSASVQGTFLVLPANKANATERWLNERVLGETPSQLLAPDESGLIMDPLVKLTVNNKPIDGIIVVSSDELGAEIVFAQGSMGKIRLDATTPRSPLSDGQ